MSEMGYSYDARTRRLCCDSCGAADGTTRKRNCPAGWCPAYAMCAACWTDPEKRAAFKSYHVEINCAGAAARFAAEQAEVAAVKATGAYVFCASVYADSTRETVRCWFRNSSDRTKELVVSLAARETLTLTSTFEAAALADLAALRSKWEAGEVDKWAVYPTVVRHLDAGLSLADCAEALGVDEAVVTDRVRYFRSLAEAAV